MQRLHLDITKAILTLAIALLYTTTSQSQDWGIDLRGIYAKSIPQAQLQAATTLTDINPGFPASFIAADDYITVEVKTTCSDSHKSATSKGHSLTTEQKEILQCADLDSDVNMVVHYNSTNVVTQEIEKRKLDFSIKVAPEKQAAYVGGYDALQAYMQTNVLDQFKNQNLTDPGTATVKFLVDKNGKVTEVEAVETTGYFHIDVLIIQALQNMPLWQPAQNIKGETLEQEFQMSVGDMWGC